MLDRAVGRAAAQGSSRSHPPFFVPEKNLKEAKTTQLARKKKVSQVIEVADPMQTYKLQMRMHVLIRRAHLQRLAMDQLIRKSRDPQEDWQCTGCKASQVEAYASVR